MNKKVYSAPEVEIEKYTIKADIVTASTDYGLDDSDNVIDF